MSLDYGIEVGQAYAEMHEKQDIKI